MCYEQRFLKSWLKQKARKREEDTTDVVRARPNVKPIRPAPERANTRRREVEREPEEIV
jgi:hypothetical protein